jgi:hypothetical protein
METAATAPILILVFFSSSNRASALYAANVANAYRSDKSVDVVAIAVGDTHESFAQARLSGMNRVKVLLDPDGSTAMKYRVAFVPQAVTIDAERQIRHVSVGSSSAARSATTKEVKALTDAHKD